MSAQTPAPAPSQTPSQPAPPAVAAPAAAPTSAAQPAPAAPAAAPVLTSATPSAPAAAPASAAAPAPAETAPDAYSINLPAPAQGAQPVQIDAAFLPAVSAALKANGVTQKQLDGILPALLAYQSGIPDRMNAADHEAVMKDPELGGLNWGKTQSFVNDAITAFTTPEFRAVLKRSGLGNNPEFVRAFAKIGKAMRSDDPARGSPTSADRESVADRMYRKSTKAA